MEKYKYNKYKKKYLILKGGEQKTSIIQFTIIDDHGDKHIIYYNVDARILSESIRKFFSSSYERIDYDGYISYFVGHPTTLEKFINIFYKEPKDKYRYDIVFKHNDETIYSYYNKLFGNRCLKTLFERNKTETILQLVKIPFHYSNNITFSEIPHKKGVIELLNAIYFYGNVDHDTDTSLPFDHNLFHINMIVNTEHFIQIMRHINPLYREKFESIDLFESICSKVEEENETCQLPEKLKDLRWKKITEQYWKIKNSYENSENSKKSKIIEKIRKLYETQEATKKKSDKKQPLDMWMIGTS